MDLWLFPDKSTFRIWASLNNVECNNIKIKALHLAGSSWLFHSLFKKWLADVIKLVAGHFVSTLMSLETVSVPTTPQKSAITKAQREVLLLNDIEILYDHSDFSFYFIFIF